MKKGFTLIELAIVLVIIGLLIGGILAAQTMIHTAKIDRLIKDLQSYEVAINNFYSSYKYYPGDAPIFTPPGNGNRELEFISPGCAAIPNTTMAAGETGHFWAHLSGSGMLKDRYTPYSPTPCGSQSNDYIDATLAGVVWPYTTISGAAAAFMGVKKYPIEANKYNTGANLVLNFVVDSDWLPAIENKLGGQTSDGTGLHQQTGLVNDYGTGNCFGNTTNCFDNNDGLGFLRYYVQPQ